VATISRVSSTQTSITVRITGLAYPANQYEFFRIKTYRTWSDANNDVNALQNLLFSDTSTSTSTGSRTFSTGMSCGTIYSFRGWARWQGVWYDLSSSNPVQNYSTSSCGALSTPNLHTLNAGETSVYVQCTTVSNANRYVFELSNGNSISSSNPYVTFTGLSPGTGYSVRFKARDWTGKYQDSPYSSWFSFTTQQAQLATPTRQSSSTTETSVTLTVNAVSNATSYDFRLYNASYSQISSSIGSSRTRTFSGLSPGTQYYIRVRAMASGWITSNFSSYFSVVTALSFNRPSNWNWSSAAVDAFNNQGLFTTLTRTEWNNFLDRINVFTDYYYQSTGQRLPSSVFASSTNPSLQASHFRTISTKINSMSDNVATEPRNVQSGDLVLGWYFTHLRTALNSIYR